MITLSEQERRFSDMMKLYSRGENMPGMDNMGEKLIVNTKNALIEKISTMLSDPAKKETAKLLAKQVYMLALVSQRTLTADELEAFVNNNVDILSGI